MRIRRIAFIGLSLVIWTLIIYITLVSRQMTISIPNEEVDFKLTKLEEGIGEQFKLNKILINDLSSVIESKKESTVVKTNNVVDSTVKKEYSAKDTVLPILVMSCNRVSVSRCLDQLIQYRPNPDQFPIIVSQDCNHQETTDVINKYGNQISLMQQPDQSDIDVPIKEKKFKGYFKIARHYGWALNQTFFNFNFESVIIVEDDLDISPDFYEYFLATYPLMKKDPTLWCISAWNDNGKADLVDSKASSLLYRTDFFPGLGWLLTKSLWLELCTKWPKAYWDDWIRQPEQRKDRTCIRPEISRTRTFGKIGVSNGLFFDKYLKYIKLDEVFVPFSKNNLSYLLKDNYDNEFIKKVYQSAVVTYQELKSDKIMYDGSVRIVYHTKDAYKRTAKLLGLMDDFKSGVPRTGYMGIVPFYYKGRRVYLTPSLNWKGYDPSWS